MKFIYTVFFAFSAVLSFVSAIPAISNRHMKRGVPEELIPQFGVTAGVNPSGTGDCEGINGIKIPCQCPPPREQFIAVIYTDAYCALHCTYNYT